MNFKRRLLSQNFLKDPSLVAHLVGLANFGPKDTVIDIGAGHGIITSELAKCCGKVIAVEIDSELGFKLQHTFANRVNVEIVISDIRQFSLPNYDYKVFANIPFHITADIVYKLLYYSNPPAESYLILPKEAAQKFAGLPHETQFSVLAKPWFEFIFLQGLDRSGFSPEPDIDVSLIKITKRGVPLVSPDEEALYKRFIKFAFGAWKKDLKTSLSSLFTYQQWKRLARNNKFNLHATPTELTLNQWLALFSLLTKNVSPEKYRAF